MNRADDLLDAFERDRWKSEPYERMLVIAHSDTSELLDLVLLSVQRLGQNTTFVDGALSFFDEDQFTTALNHAVAHMAANPTTVDGDSPAEAVVAYASLQFRHLLVKHLEVLWRLAPNQSSYYAEWPWRASPPSERQRLLALLENDAASRERSWRALLETRDADTINAALAIVESVAPFLQGPPSRWLPEVGYVLEDQQLRRVTPPACFHLDLPRSLVQSRWERPAHLRPSNHPTWHNLGRAAHAARLGGISGDVCGTCGGQLHRLLALDHVPSGLGVSSRSHLELATCLSCLGWTGPWLFYAHDDAGAPHPVDRASSYSAPQFPSEALAEGTVGLVPTPDRWLLQDWALSNGRENLNRLGGELTWIQSADHPTCPRCGRLMTSLMQLDSDLAVEGGGEFLWGSGGIGYVMWCDGCAVSGVTAQWT